MWLLIETRRGACRASCQLNADHIDTPPEIRDVRVVIAGNGKGASSRFVLVVLNYQHYADFTFEGYSRMRVSMYGANGVQIAKE